MNKIKVLLISIMFVQTLFAKSHDAPDTILDFTLLNGKKVNLFIEDDVLHYTITKDKTIELSFPKYINKDSMFYLNITKDKLTFSNTSATYTIYQTIKNYEISQIGIKVKIKNEIYDLKGDIKTLRGDLREFDEMGLVNLDDKKELLKYHKNKEHSKVVSRSYKEPRLVYRLNLDSTHIKEFRSGFKKFVNLEKLYLRNNKLKSLPDFICKFKKLRHLSLEFNKLTSLPECIGELENLVFLDIRGNKIEKLPSSINDLKYLKYLKSDKKYVK